MDAHARALLIAAVAAVGVLHTAVPDHWAPIVAIARQRGWSRADTAKAATVAGLGHVGSTLLIALVVWLAGAAAAQRFGHTVDLLSSLALIGFGLWVAVSAGRELRHGHAHAHPHDHGHEHEHDYGFAFDPLYRPLPAGAAALTRHVHVHRHGGGPPHRHWHDHTAATLHPLGPAIEADPPLHDHRHRTGPRTALLVILGSSPMVEGIPLFFAASRFGAAQLAAMAAVFAAATIATYALLCAVSLAGVARLRLGAFERYGEVLSGAVIALVGVAFGLWRA